MMLSGMFGFRIETCQGLATVCVYV